VSSSSTGVQPTNPNQLTNPPTNQQIFHAYEYMEQPAQLNTAETGGRNIATATLLPAVGA
jgi:hypothetical protein